MQSWVGEATWAQRWAALALGQVAQLLRLWNIDLLIRRKAGEREEINPTALLIWP